MPRRCRQPPPGRRQRQVRTNGAQQVPHVSSGGDLVDAQVERRPEKRTHRLAEVDLQSDQRDGYGDPLRYDKVFYFGEQDYYIPMNPDGTSRRFESFIDQMGPMLEVRKGLIPTHIALNGEYGALTREIRLEAEVGESALNK